jgi:DNA gyrase/topoisomerase IV subunit B
LSANTEIRTDLVNTVREELLHFFNRNKDIATKIVEKVTDTQQLRVLAHGQHCRR